ncbi:MAG: hypothetical protein Q7S19_02430 [bacterium]|nr:hypothetical protein [bacterium]
MSKDKVLEAISTYRNYFEGNKIEKKSFPHDQHYPTRRQIMMHCHTMLDKMEAFIQEGKMEKTFRWLGFIQGCLWSESIHNLEELKDHNRTK